MTPQEKAKELLNKFKMMVKITSIGDVVVEDNVAKSKKATAQVAAKECALICVDELIQNVYDTDYWAFVKKEIEKL